MLVEPEGEEGGDQRRHHRDQRKSRDQADSARPEPRPKVPMVRAASNPSRLKTSSTLASLCGEHATRRPPLVCGSVKTFFCQSSSPDNFISLPYPFQFRVEAPVKTPAFTCSIASGITGTS